MTIRSRIRPTVYNLINAVGWLILIWIPLGLMLLTVIIATSFFWIPYAIVMWFEEKPVWKGLKHWFLEVLLKPAPMGRCFRL